MLTGRAISPPRPSLAAAVAGGVEGFNQNQMKCAVRVAIKGALKDVPDVYDEVKFEAALAAVYEHVYESYWGDGKSAYADEGAT